MRRRLKRKRELGEEVKKGEKTELEEVEMEESLARRRLRSRRELG